MFRSKKKELPLAADVLLGAAAGALGAYMMSPAQQLVAKAQTEEGKKKEQENSWDENATIKTARMFAKPLHLKLPEKKKEQIGYAVHFAYGATLGAVYALARRKVPGFAFANGLLLGFGLWLFSDEIAVPALGLAPGPENFPFSTHMKALGAHLAYGATTDGVIRLGRRLASP